MSKVELASSLGINSTTYAGESASGYIAAAMLQSDSVERGLVTVVENVKTNHVLQVLSDTGGLIDAYGCDFANADDLDVNEKVLALTNLMVNIQLCKSQFHGQLWRLEAVEQDQKFQLLLRTFFCCM